MRKSLLLALLVCVCGFAKAQNLLTESFDGTTFPPTGWTRAIIVNNGGTALSYNWERRTAAPWYPYFSPHTGAAMAVYESYNISTGGVAELVTPSLSFTVAGNKILKFWCYNASGFGSTFDSLRIYVNTTASSTGGTLVANVIPHTAAATGWIQYTYTLPSSFTSGTNYIIFRGVSGYGYDIGLDDVTVDNIPPCTSPVTAGTASISSSPACASTPLTLTATGYTVAAGMAYRWQSSPAGANTWTNITGATTPVFTLAAGITTATDFRFVDTCLAASASAISNVVAVTINSPLNCYCIPTTSNGCLYQDDIKTFNLTGFAGTGISQSTACTNTSQPGGYTNFTNLTPVKMIQGGTYTGSMSTEFFSEYARIWIDYNDDGFFFNSESVWNSAGTVALYTSTTAISILIPTAAQVGIHRMRVRLVYNVSPASSLDPCQSTSPYDYGEARDYLVNILSSIPPPPVVVTNAPVCPGSTLTITATDTSGYPGPITYNLTGPFAASPILNSTSGVFSIPNVTAANAGTYIVSMNSGISTSNPVLVNVTVYNAANLVIGTIVPPTTCQGTNGSFNITGLIANTSYTLKYRNPAGTTITTTIPSSSATTYPVTGLGAGTYDSIRVVAITSGSGGCTSNYTVAVVPAPNPPPTPIPTHNTPLCPGSTLSLSITNIGVYPSGSTFSWTGPNSFTSTSPTPTRPNMSSANNGLYKVTVTVNGCISAEGVDSVVVSPPDPSPLPISPTYCQYDIAQPLAAQGINLTFYGPAAPNPGGTTDSTNIVRNPAQLPRTDIPGIWIYYVTQNSTCVSPRAVIQVTVKAKPAKPNVPVTTVDYCQFSPSTPLSASGINIRWYATPTGGVGSAAAPSPNTLVSGTYYYYVSQTVNGCESDRQTITVNVKPKPAPPKVVSPLNLCQGDPIAPVTAIGQNLLWYTGPTGGVGVPVAPIPNTGYEDSFRYWVSQVVNGCESDRALIAVYVNYKPNGVIVGSNQWVCQDDTLSFYYYGNARPDAQYVWFSPYPASTIVSGGGTRGPVVIHFDSAGTAVVRLQINNKGCISTLIAAPITVRPLPKFDYALKQDVCVDELVNIALVSTEPGISSYAYDFGSTDTTMVYSAPPGGPFGIRYLKAGTYTVAATATLNMCTSKPLKKDLYVHELPDATIVPPAGFDPTKPVCASDTLNLTVKAVQGGASYTWTPAAYFQSYQDTLNYLVRAVVNRTSYVKVKVRTAYGCEAEDSLLVKTQPCCNVFFPNAFAPDGNIEQNRRFKPITVGFHEVNTFKVINRWGAVVYETKSLPKSVNSGWDGLYNGVRQDMGTYFWYISYKCEGKTVEDHGEVILVR